MTKLSAIEQVARAAGAWMPGILQSESPGCWALSPDALAAFADRIRADEREKCAKELTAEADHMEKNSKAVAKYEGMEAEARARKLASVYVRELADLWRMKETSGLTEEKE